MAQKRTLVIINTTMRKMHVKYLIVFEKCRIEKIVFPN